MQIKEPYNRHQAAKILGCSLSMLDKLIHAGQLPAYRVGRKILIEPEAIRQYIDRNAIKVGV